MANTIEPAGTAAPNAKAPDNPGLTGGVWAWGQRTRMRLAELESLCELMASRPGAAPNADRLRDQALELLRRAERSLGRHRPWPGKAGAVVDAVETGMNSAYCLMLSYMPLADFQAWLPELMTLIEEHLSRADNRLIQAQRVFTQAQQEFEKQDPSPVTETQRTLVVAAVRAALGAQQHNLVKLRSFRNTVVVATVVMFLLAIAIAYMAYKNPNRVPLCFTPNGEFVCPIEETRPLPAEPSPSEAYQDADSWKKYEEAHAQATAETTDRWDYFVVELAGLVAAALAAAMSLRRFRGTSVPYGVPLAMGVLKLPTGALTALLGLLLMKGEFVPGLSALDSSAQIVAWALVFGYSQQLFTHLVDERGKALINAVGGEDAPLPSDGQEPPRAVPA